MRRLFTILIAAVIGTLSVIYAQVPPLSGQTEPRAIRPTREGQPETTRSVQPEEKDALANKGASSQRNEKTVAAGEQARPIDRPQLILSIANLLITASLGLTVYKLIRKVRGEAQLEYFRMIHKEFWDNVEMKKVRFWLACPEAYASEVAPVLQDRISSPRASSNRYEVLESLDNFLNYMTTVVVLSREFFNNRQKEVLDETFFGYWIGQTLDDKSKPELSTYVRMFYGHVHTAADRHNRKGI